MGIKKYLPKKEYPYELAAPTYLVTKIGKDVYIHGFHVQTEDKKFIVVPDYVYYKEQNINPITLNGDIDSFGYLDDDGQDYEPNLKKQINRVEIISSFIEKAELIKNKYTLIKEKRCLDKESTMDVFDSKLRDNNFYIAIVSLLVGIFFNKLLKMPNFYLFLSMFVIVTLLIKFNWDWLSKRYRDLYKTIDYIILLEQEEAMTTISYANILRIFWKKQPPTVHLLLNKGGYSKWIEKMKKLNLDKLGDKIN